MDAIDLASGRLRARVHPNEGASFDHLNWLGPEGWMPVLVRGPAPEGTPRALASALFPMLPFANRARGGRLQADGAAFRVSPNAADPLALHGTGWERPWELVSRQETSCHIRLRVDASSYPFAFNADLLVSLDDDVLQVACVLRNTDTRAIPAGLGFHPYFPRDATTRLRFGARIAWLEGLGHLPTRPRKMTSDVDFASPRGLPMDWRNDAYSGWTGAAEIVQPSLGYRLVIDASPSLGEVMLYTPPDEPCFALEPQSHTSGATSGPDDPSGSVGLIVLEPDESLFGYMRMTVTGL